MSPCMISRMRGFACVYVTHFSPQRGFSLICIYKVHVITGVHGVCYVDVRMLVFHVLTFLLSFLWPTHTSSEADCQPWQDLDSAVVHKEGHVILAAMFPIHSKGLEQELNFMSTPDKRKCKG